MLHLYISKSKIVEGLVQYCTLNLKLSDHKNKTKNIKKHPSEQNTKFLKISFWLLWWRLQILYCQLNWTQKNQKSSLNFVLWWRNILRWSSWCWILWTQSGCLSRSRWPLCSAQCGCWASRPGCRTGRRSCLTRGAGRPRAGGWTAGQSPAPCWSRWWRGWCSCRRGRWWSTRSSGCSRRSWDSWGTGGCLRLRTGCRHSSSQTSSKWK